MFARLACTRANKVTVWFQRDQSTPTKIKIDFDSNIDDLKEAIFCATDKGQYQATYNNEPLRPLASVPRNTTDHMPIVFTRISNIPPPSEQTQTKKNKYQQSGITVAGGNGKGQELNQLYGPRGICIDNDKSIYIADFSNHRIVKWKLNSNTGKIMACGNGKENQLYNPRDIIFDKQNKSFIISDVGRRRVVRYFDKNQKTLISKIIRKFGRHQKKQQIIISNIFCEGLTIDNNGYIYVSDYEKHEVRRWEEGDEEGELVAGGNGQ
ncbi:unnamed protein product [Adineta steineri]|uniref:Uncharacterized protein n=1 Tax=Adineta steineri TaxID=433720 RepID=A0A813XYE9_9BILA|nr:unnamed protein product [Adineta steineri]CAF0913758.1 unnamed protein product [Adineta steineri]